MRAGQPGLLLSLAVALLLGQGGAAQPQSPSGDPRFGVIESYDAPEAAAELGAGWTRVKFHWGWIQPEGPDHWVEPDFDGQDMGPGVEAVGLLIGVPDWARDTDGLPRGLDLPVENPGNLWAGYVREVIRRHGGEIRHWIIWNEPDIWDSSHPTYTWPGSVEDFAQMMRVSYLVAKRADPDAVIHLPAMTHWWDANHGRDLYFGRLLDALAAAPEARSHDHYFDVATMHVYFNSEDVYRLVSQYRVMLADRGLDKPIWLVETNAAPSSDPARLVEDPTFRVSLLEQAAYLPQAISLALAADVERVAVFKLIDTPGDIAANPEPFGLIRMDGTQRPAYTTLRVAMGRLAGVESAWWIEQGAVAQVVAQRPDEVVRVLWSRRNAPQGVRVAAFSHEAMLIDQWGQTQRVLPEGGSYELLLPAGECQQTVEDACMIGGPVQYLVETGAAQAEEAYTVHIVEVEPKEIEAAPPVWIGWSGLLALSALAGGAAAMLGWSGAARIEQKEH